MIGYLNKEVKFGIMTIAEGTLVSVDEVYNHINMERVPAHIVPSAVYSEEHEDELSLIFNPKTDTRITSIVVNIEKDLIDFQDVHYTEEEIKEIGF